MAYVPGLGTSYQDYVGNPDQPPAIYSQAGVTGGRNPIKPLVKRAGVGLGLRGLQQVAFGNELEPQRQAAVRRAVTLTDPGNAPALINQFGKRAVADALEFARIRGQAMQGQGLGAGAQTGATNATFGEAQTATNNFAGQVLSSGGQLAALRDNLAAIGLGQDTELIALLSQLEGALQQSNATKPPSEGNALLGTLGSLGGAVLSNPGLFKK